jgi:hypothetical protein
LSKRQHQQKSYFKFCTLQQLLFGRHCFFGEIEMSDTADKLAEALRDCLSWMEMLRDSGDAGFWNWSEQDEYGKGTAALAAHEAEAKAAPADWVLVPVEPTDAMFRAADKEDEAAYVGGADHGASASAIWDAMLAAAPVNPSPTPAPLTDEQIEAATACLGFGQLSPITVARAIERAHNIGDNK